MKVKGSRLPAAHPHPEIPTVPPPGADISYKVCVSFLSISGDREPKDYGRGFPFPLAMWVSLHVL